MAISPLPSSPIAPTSICFLISPQPQALFRNPNKLTARDPPVYPCLAVVILSLLFLDRRFPRRIIPTVMLLDRSTSTSTSTSSCGNDTWDFASCHSSRFAQALVLPVSFTSSCSTSSKYHETASASRQPRFSVPRAVSPPRAQSWALDLLRRKVGCRCAPDN